MNPYLKKKIHFRLFCLYDASDVDVDRKNSCFRVFSEGVTYTSAHNRARFIDIRWARWSVLARSQVMTVRRPQPLASLSSRGFRVDLHCISIMQLRPAGPDGDRRYLACAWQVVPRGPKANTVRVRYTRVVELASSNALAVELLTRAW